MALINCPDCNNQVSSSAPSCPKCGAPIAAAPLNEKKGNYIPYTDQEVAVMLSQKQKTSHLLHLLLCIPTLGFWVIVWVLVAAINGTTNASIDNKIAKGKKVR